MLTIIRNKQKNKEAIITTNFDENHLKQVSHVMDKDMVYVNYVVPGEKEVVYHVFNADISYLYLIRVLSNIFGNITNESFSKLTIDLKNLKLDSNIVLNTIIKLMNKYLVGSKIDVFIDLPNNFKFIKDDLYLQKIKKQVIPKKYSKNYNHQNFLECLDFSYKERNFYEFFKEIIRINSIKGAIIADDDYDMNVIFKKANVGSKTKHKIKKNLIMKPKYNLIVQLAIAAKLNINNTRKLLEFTNQSLSRYNKKDVFLEKVIESNYKKINISNLDEKLINEGLEPMVRYNWGNKNERNNKTNLWLSE